MIKTLLNLMDTEDSIRLNVLGNNTYFKTFQDISRHFKTFQDISRYLKNVLGNNRTEFNKLGDAKEIFDEAR